MLISVFKDADPSRADHHYVSYTLMSDVDPNSIGETSYQTLALAQKNAQKKMGFRKRLLDKCQHEFQSAVISRTMYDDVDKERAALREKAPTMTAEERQQAEAELEEKEGKLKRRLLAIIRFIGELCKESLLKTSIMHECIINLIGTTDEDGEFNGWKAVQDEQCIELLCRLLHTIGAKLEETASDQQLEKIKWYFDRLKTLSVDKVRDCYQELGVGRRRVRLPSIDVIQPPAHPTPCPLRSPSTLASASPSRK